MAPGQWTRAVARARGIVARGRTGWDVARRTTRRSLSPAEIAEWDSLRAAGRFEYLGRRERLDTGEGTDDHD